MGRIGSKGGQRPTVDREPVEGALTPPCSTCKYPLVKTDRECPRCRWEGRGEVLPPAAADDAREQARPRRRTTMHGDGSAAVVLA